MDLQCKSNVDKIQQRTAMKARLLAENFAMKEKNKRWLSATDKTHRGHTQAFCTYVLLACGCYAPMQICIREENGVSEHGEWGESGVLNQKVYGF